MKKIKVLLSALAMVAAMAFISCGGGADPTTGGTSGAEPVKFSFPDDIKWGNDTAFTGKWQGGFVVTFDEPVDLSTKSTLKLDAVFYDANGKVISADWGLGQYLLLANVSDDWANNLKVQYNLGMQDMDLGGLTGTAAGVAIQSSSDDVKYIGIRSYTFE